MTKIPQKTGLEALLGASLAVEDTVYIPRLKTNFTVRALTSADLQKARQQATVGRDGTVDETLLNRLVIAKGCVDPDFNDKALRDHYAAEDAADCVDKALLPGELVRIIQAIMALSGFGDEDEVVEEAKN
ncbi:hypothetical protein P4H42_03450 [Paenibacillus macerans]|uniref:phage tail assembly chaperone n=1 Tax=Paenibacillus macerans TaxID=44252 RepID=UPI002DB9D57C|nr:hypothetical protein [Paenibacillus macerans]MEC0328677.1 hypothetical protein [Paenibacillus macerans]